MAQEVAPARHEPGFWQAAPVTQATQAPPLQTWSVPQEVPFGSGVAESVQTEVPVAQEVVPVRQGSGFVAQAAPAVHATQLPALQTWSVPQVVPFAMGVAVSTQASVPVEQDVVPATQGSGFEVQARPDVQATHAPALQTWFVPQTVPLAVVGGPVHAGLGCRSRRRSCRRGRGRGSCCTPRPPRSALQAPPLQTRFVPQDVPFGSGAAALSRQVGLPVLHEVVPPRHGFGVGRAGRPRRAGDARRRRRADQVRPAARAGRLGGGVHAGLRPPSRRRSCPVAERVRVRGAGDPRDAARCTCRPADEIRTAERAVRLRGRRVVHAGLRRRCCKRSRR